MRSMNDTELLEHLLGHLHVTNDNDLDWPYSELVEGLYDAGESREIVDALIERKRQFETKQNKVK